MTVERINASERKFGIEVEGFVPSRHSRVFPRGTNTRPIPLQDEDGNELPFRCAYDGSLIPPSGYMGIEIVSDVMQGEEGIISVAQMMETIRQDYKGQTNTSCGLHVHVDATDLTVEQVMQVVSNYILFEPAFYAVAGPDGLRRYNGRFAKGSQHWVIEDDYDPETNPQSNGDFRTFRYQGLNISNYFLNSGSKRTIEFRLFPGSFCYEDITTAILMSVGLVCTSANDGAFHRLPGTETRDNLTDFFQWCFAGRGSESFVMYEGVDGENSGIWDVYRYALKMCQDSDIDLSGPVAVGDTSLMTTNTILEDIEGLVPATEEQQKLANADFGDDEDDVEPMPLFLTPSASAAIADEKDRLYDVFTSFVKGKHSGDEGSIMLGNMQVGKKGESTEDFTLSAHYLSADSDSVALVLATGLEVDFDGDPVNRKSIRRLYPELLVNKRKPVNDRTIKRRKHRITTSR